MARGLISLGLELSVIPEALSSYHTNWQNLDLGFNRFQTWPNLSQFQSLQELWLTGAEDVSGARVCDCLSMVTTQVTK